MRGMYVSIPNYPLYLINEYGDVVSCMHGKWKPLKKWENSKGYPSVKLTNSAGSKKWLVSRLVLSAWVGPSSLDVLHVDNNPMNNQLSNLKYGTHSQNILQMWDDDLRKRKLDFWDRVEIAKKYSKGQSQNALAKEYGVSHALIWCIVSNHKGFIYGLRGPRNVN